MQPYPAHERSAVPRHDAAAALPAAVLLGPQLPQPFAAGQGLPHQLPPEGSHSRRSGTTGSPVLFAFCCTPEFFVLAEHLLMWFFNNLLQGSNETVPPVRSCFSSHCNAACPWCGHVLLEIKGGSDSWQSSSFVHLEEVSPGYHATNEL